MAAATSQLERSLIERSFLVCGIQAGGVKVKPKELNNRLREILAVVPETPTSPNQIDSDEELAALEDTDQHMAEPVGALDLSDSDEEEL